MRRFLSLLLLIVLPLLCRAQVDTTVGIAVKGGKDYKALAHELCDGLRGDQLKANAIYNWITHNIRYDVVAMQNGKLKPPKVETVLKTRLAVCDGYAKLFTAMCNEVGLKAVNIDGYSKDWIFDNGDKMIIPRHMWSAVLISAQWQLVDPTWGAGGLVQAPTVMRKIIDKVTFRKVSYAKKLKFQFRYNPEYFVQDPLLFRLKHLPADPYWQLTDTAMPLAVFEAGDSAVKAFNARYNQLRQNSSELMRISSLDEDSVLFEASDRAYTFNERFPVALALKQTARVNADVQKVFNETDPDKSVEMWKDAEHALKIAEAHIKEQKKYFPEQYNALKKKNRTKNTAAKQYMMQITTTDKKLAAQCNKYNRSANTKYARVNKKYNETGSRKKGLDPKKINDLDASKVQKAVSSPEMIALSDSISGREMRIATMKGDIEERGQAIRALQEENRARLDTLAQCLGMSDSFLLAEAKARMQMNDNYDDEVIKWSSLYRQEKFGKADQLHRNYMACYDTIITHSENRYKVMAAALDCYKKNLKDIEKYARWNMSDTLVSDRYAGLANEYEQYIDSCTNELLRTAEYIKNNKKLFANMGVLYNRQLKIVGYMGKVEEVRKNLELNTITSKQALDLNENKKQATTVKTAVKKMEKVYK